MRVAVIDLGTNTSNLLLAEAADGRCRIIRQSKEYVRLGDQKIAENLLSREGIQRATDAIKKQVQLSRNFAAKVITIIATSAVREAKNQTELVEKIGLETGIFPEIVTGDREAELIFKGVLLAFRQLPEPVMILDIGGGSNEIILGHHNRILWKESFPAGMSRVVSRFTLSDPLTSAETTILADYLQNIHASAIRQARRLGVQTVIGCSGAFDTLADIADQVNPGEKQRTAQEIPPDIFYRIVRQLLSSTRQQRLSMKGMDRVRLDLIVPAVILIEKIISETGIQRIYQTDFALREGVLYETITPDSAITLPQ